jgi:Fe-S-cluster containining protein
VNVTYLDILRLSKGLKLSLNETLDIVGFYVFDKDLSKIAREHMVISPIETEKGLAFPGLLKKDNGECLFYNKKEQKCNVYKIRPMFCRTFPFTFESSTIKSKVNREGIKIFYTEKAKSYCPGIGSDAPIIKYDYWVKLAKKTLIELNNNHIFNKRWNEKVRNKSVALSVKNFILTILEMNGR